MVEVMQASGPYNGILQLKGWMRERPLIGYLRISAYCNPGDKGIFGRERQRSGCSRDQGGLQAVAADRPG
jgi:hypothetical protein